MFYIVRVNIVFGQESLLPFFYFLTPFFALQLVSKDYFGAGYTVYYTGSGTNGRQLVCISIIDCPTVSHTTSNCGREHGSNILGELTWCLKEVQATKNSPTVESGFFGRY